MRPVGWPMIRLSCLRLSCLLTQKASPPVTRCSGDVRPILFSKPFPAIPFLISPHWQASLVALLMRLKRYSNKCCWCATNTSLPVIKLLSSDARNATAPAASLGSPRRSSGTVRFISFRASDGSNSINLSVLVGPGDMTFTRMPVPLRSWAQLRTRFRTAALEAL